MNAQRLFYIDALRGLAILAVVIGHLDLFCFKIVGEGLSPSTFVNYFHLSLFMMISGYVTNVEKFSIVGRVKLLVPFLVFGLIFTCYAGLPLGGFFSNEAKNGYWFLWAIVLFFLTLHIFRKVKIPIWLGFVIVEVGFVGLHLWLRRTVPGTTLSTDHLWSYYPFFVFGIVMRKGLLSRILAKSKLWFIVNIVLIVLIAFALKAVHNDFIHKVVTVTMGFPTTINLFIAFYHLERRFANVRSTAKRWMRQIGTDLGTHSLEIYVLHYFVLQWLDLSQIKLYISSDNIYLLEYIVSPFISLAICYACIVVARLLYKVHLGGLFGRL